jgi:TonB family protein
VSDIETKTLEYLLNSLWQVPLIFAAAWIAARIARSSGPPMEHRIWVTALVLQTVVPACSFRLESVLHKLWALLLRGPSAAGGLVHVVEGAATVSGAVALRIPLEALTAVAAIYGCTLLYFAVRLGWGLYRTSVLTHQAESVTLTDEAMRHWQRCAAIFGCESARIAASPEMDGPVTVGGRQGVVLVPPRFLQSSAELDLDAVLAHEFAHMKRHDFLKNLVYGALSLPVAYHPFLWMTKSRIAETREMICDGMAAQAVDGTEPYVRSLMRLASLLVKGTPDKTLHAIGIFDANIFERRVMNLTQKRVEIKGVRRFAIAATCAAVGVATCASALALRMDVATPSTTAAQNENGKPVKVAPAIMAEQSIYKKNPVYPPTAKETKDILNGPVVLHVIIGKDGAVKHIQIKKSLRADYDQSALEAVKDWTYKPFLLSGNPVEVETTVTVNYSMNN